MTHHPMNAAGVLAALAMMKPPRKIHDLRAWVSRQRVIAHLAHYDTKDVPVEVAETRIAQCTGMSRNTVRDALTDCVEARILQREQGSSQVANSFRFVPDVALWRVEWHVSVTAVEGEVGLATGALKATEAFPPRVTWDARRKRFRARPMQRAAESGPPRVTWDARRDVQPLLEKPGLTRDGNLASYNYSRDGDQKLAISSEQSEVLNKIKAAYVKRLQLRFLRGEPERLLSELVVSGATAEELLELVMRMPSDKEVLSGVEWMAIEWHGRGIDVEPAEDQERREEIVSRLRGLRTQAETWRNVEEAEEVLFEIELEIAELEKLQSDELIYDEPVIGTAAE